MGEHVRLLGHGQHEHHPQGGQDPQDADVEEEHVQLSDIVGGVQVVYGQELSWKKTKFLLNNYGEK